jgi:16S rRNA G966 N2-methylase RsmD
MNIEKAGFVEQSKIVRTDAFKVSLPVDSQHPAYDLIFVDPPYVASASTQEGSPLASLLIRLAERLSDDGFVIVRTEIDTTLLQTYGPLKIIERREWGTMAVTILKKEIA